MCIRTYSDHLHPFTMANLTQPLNGGNFLHQQGPGPDCGTLLDRLSLKGETAIVTGAGGGIGLSVAQAFAELGANVAIWYNTNEAAHDRAREISERYGVQCMPKFLLLLRDSTPMLKKDRQSVQSQRERIRIRRRCR